MKHRKDVYMKTAPQKSAKEPESSDDEKNKTSPKVSDVWLPETNTAFRLLMSANLCSALMSHITDCDETFNYWEPLHHLMYGEGFQTWEYSPVYAIRSWAYIGLHYISTWAQFGLLNDNKLFVFYFIRIMLGIVCTICEVYFYEGVAFRFGNNVARLTLTFLIFGTGMFISATAFLPSSFCMYMTMLYFGNWMRGSLNYALLAVAAAGIIGWPFSVALGIPLAVDIIVRRQRYIFFMKWVGIALLAMLLPCTLIDTFFYGKLVIAPLNILLYNVFTDHGPNIYGTEPFSFYFLNGFLNFNVVFVLAVASVIVVPLAEALIHYKYHGYRSPSLLLTFTLAPMYLWMLIFFAQPHKEERFLFPIYPLICLNAAVTLATVTKVCTVYRTVIGVRFNIRLLQLMAGGVAGVFIVISCLRTAALFQGYHAPMEIYAPLQHISARLGLSNQTSEIRVCVGKEWYRFPSSFFLPKAFTLRFVRSEFRGQLPARFVASGHHGTRAVLKHFNDANREETGRYVRVESCHFMVDLDTGVESAIEPRYGTVTDNWTVINEIEFLDSSRSPSQLHRAFYIPFSFGTKNVFGKYQLLQSKMLKVPMHHTSQPVE